MPKPHNSLDFSPGRAVETEGGSAAAVPRCILYGDNGSRSDWFVNLERLEERGRERGWLIAPHTHPRFTQIMICIEGGGQMTIEGETSAFGRGSVIVIPPFRVHGFQYNEASFGWVLTVENDYLRDLLVRAPGLKPVLQRPGVLDLPPAQLSALEEAIALLSGELDRTRSGAAIGSEIHLLSILLLLLRNSPDSTFTPVASGSRQALVERYRAAIEDRYREQPSLPTMAAGLGVSLSQLRLACQSVAGLSPIAILHDRILTEAKRCLTYTGMSVSEIADWLGFTDAPYFSRFFAKALAKTPTAYRREQNFRAREGE